MSYQELLDTLISDGHQKVTLYSGRLHTDDGSTEVHFLISEDGDTVARNLHEAGGHSGWTMCNWAIDSGRCRPLYEIWEIDLTDRKDADLRLCMFH